MELLNGHCKKNFDFWLSENYKLISDYKDGSFYYLPIICQNALIVDFFDSNDIKISVHFETFGNYYFNAMVTKGHLTTNLRLNSENRNDAITEAIKHSNKHYNDNCRVVFSDFL